MERGRNEGIEKDNGEKENLVHGVNIYIEEMFIIDTESKVYFRHEPMGSEWVDWCN